MAIRYQNTFKSLANVTWKIDIYDTEYTGDVNLFTTDKGGFELSYKGATERLDPILASSVSIPVIVTDATIEAFLVETMAAQEERFTVVITKGTTVYWVGVLLSDLITKEDIGYPYTFELTFTDGLARLKDVEYCVTTYPNPYEIIKTPYPGRETIIEHLLKILSRTGTWHMFSDLGLFLFTAIDWYEENHSYQSSACPLAKTTIGHTVFYTYDSEPTENPNNGTLETLITFMSCYEVLEMILRTFNARILMVNGYWYVIQPQVYSKLSYYERVFRRDGTFLTSLSTTHKVTPLSTVRKGGGLHKYIAPLLSVSKNYVPKTSCFEDGRLLDRSRGGVAGVYPLLEYIPKDEVLEFSGYINELADYNSDTYYSMYYIQVIATPLVGGSPYYLSMVGNGYEWTTSSTSVFYGTQMRYTSGDPYEAYTLIDFTTAPFPVNCSVTFEFAYYGSWLEGGAPYTIPAGEHFLSFLAGDSIYPTVFLNDTDKVQFIETNMQTATTPVTSKLKLELPDTFLSDEPLFNIGRLEVTHDDVTWYHSALWSVGSSTNRFKINQLSVKTNLIGQRIPTQKYQGGWADGTITALTAVSTPIAGMLVPLSIKIMPSTDECEGEWFNVLLPII